MHVTLLMILLLALLLVSNIQWETQVYGQASFDRSFNWAVNGNLVCGGTGACYNGQKSELVSSDFQITTGFTRFSLVELDSSCVLQNYGPDSAAFDLGVVFGGSVPSVGPPGYIPEQADGTYRGVAFGWLDSTIATASWSIDFINGNVMASGAPIYSEQWLRTDANTFDSPDGIIHLILAIWSGAPTTFTISISTCKVHVTVEGSQPLVDVITRLVTSTEVSKQTVEVTNWAITVVAAIAAFALGAIICLTAIPRRKQRHSRPTTDETEQY